MSNPRPLPSSRGSRAAGAPVRYKRTDSERSERGLAVERIRGIPTDRAVLSESRCAVSGASWAICQCLACVWCRFLASWTWDWFVTLTFRREIHPEAADKKFSVWLSQLNCELHGRRWRKHGRMVRWARALEYQRRGVIHFHALLGGENLTKLRRLTWMDRWHHLDESEAGRRRKAAMRLGKKYFPTRGVFTGYARIEPPESQGGVRGYVSKYLTKDGEIDIGGLTVEKRRSGTGLPVGRGWPTSTRRWRQGPPAAREVKRFEAAALAWNRDPKEARGAD